MTSTDGDPAADGTESDAPRTGGNRSAVGERGDESCAGTGADGETAEVLRGRLEVLVAENRRLRERYEHARRTAHRRTAAGLAAVGLVAVAGGLALPASRTVLFAVGATGLFAAVLVAGLPPARSVGADTATAVYDARARLGPALGADLGLSGERVYVPTGAPDGDDPARLFVPRHRRYVVPDLGPGEEVVVAPGDERAAGLSVAPTGVALYREFRSWSRRETGRAPDVVAAAVADALGTGFGLVESVRVDVVPDAGEPSDRGPADVDEPADADEPAGGGPAAGEDVRRPGGADAGGGAATFGVAGSALGPVDRFDHPVASFAGVALAAELSVPVAVSVRAAAGDRADYLVTCRWPAGTA